MVYKKHCKRFFDITVVLVSAIVIVPVILLLVLLVRIFLGAPIFFQQVRPGLHGKTFTIYKFRTMKELRDANGKLLPDEQRLTKFGCFLRKTSLDELPELWNVLQGDMSLVGPRPLLVEYLDKYTAEQSRRHDVRPGITGLAQVNGRQDIPFSKRLELDVYYVNNCNFLLDLKILFYTFVKVLFCFGVRSGQDVKVVDDIGLCVDKTKR